MEKVLIVDNSPKHIASCRRLLHDNSFETIEACSFEVAQTLFAQHKETIAVIILACSMGSCPPFNPFPFAQFIRKEGFGGVVIGTSNCQSHRQSMKLQWSSHFTDATDRDPHRILWMLQYCLKTSSA